MGIQDRDYMRRPPPEQPPPQQQPPRQQRSRQPLGSAWRLTIIVLIGLVLVLATALAAAEAQRCREGLNAPICRI